MKKYAVWNKKDPVLTPIGEVLSADQWIERYPIAGLDTITVVCGAGEINGAFFGTLGQMRQIREQLGADFSSCKTDEEILEAIEAFDDAQSSHETEEISTEELTATSLASIAASMEFQNMMSLDDVEGV